MSGGFDLPDLSPPILLRIGIGIRRRVSAMKEMALRARSSIIALRHRIFNARARVVFRLIDNQPATLIATSNSYAQVCEADRHSIDRNTRGFLIALIMIAFDSAYELANRSISINNTRCCTFLPLIYGTFNRIPR